MKDVKPKTTITHIFLSTIVGVVVMYFAIDFSQTENLNRLMDSFFWLAFTPQLSAATRCAGATSIAANCSRCWPALWRSLCCATACSAWRRARLPRASPTRSARSLPSRSGSCSSTRSGARAPNCTLRAWQRAQTVCAALRGQLWRRARRAAAPRLALRPRPAVDRHATRNGHAHGTVASAGGDGRCSAHGARDSADIQWFYLFELAFYVHSIFAHCVIETRRRCTLRCSAARLQSRSSRGAARAVTLLRC